MHVLHTILRLVHHLTRGRLGPALLLVGLAATGCATTGQAFADLEYPEAVSNLHTVEVGSVEVTYADQGQGEQAVVLIHGLGSYLPVWKNNVPALAERYRVIAIDLPGYGKSSKSEDYAYSMAFFAEVVQGVIEQLELHQPVVVGHSMGGQIALTHALRYPGVARALVLTSPAGLETFEDGEAKWLADAVTDEFTCLTPPDVVYERLAANFYRMPKDARFMATDRVAVIGGPDFPQYCQAVSRSVRAMLDEPVYERLPEVTAPVLVLFARQDPLIPNPFLHGGSTERMARRTVKQLPHAELKILRKTGHMAQFESHAAWNEAVLEFLAKLPAPALKTEPTEQTEKNEKNEKNEQTETTEGDGKDASDGEDAGDVEDANEAEDAGDADADAVEDGADADADTAGEDEATPAGDGESDEERP
ncbi:MAG: alpha/beta hydrolase [Myxococcales bacterium]|nr:alpha/beta hydrolase [Myxococcales bacterium]